MSQKTHRAQLLIEWDREWVRVHFVESSQTKEASTLAGIDGANGKTAIVFLSRRLVLHRGVALPDAAKADAMVALKMRLGDIFPIPASELAFDFIPTTEKNENGRVCNVFAVRTSDIAEINSVCQGMGIDIEQIVPSQALTLKVAEQNAISSGVFVERFGDLLNLDAYRYGDLLASKTVSMSSLDTEVARMRAMTGDGAKIVAFNAGLPNVDVSLERPYFESYFKSPLAIDLEPEEYRIAHEEKERQRRHRSYYLIFILGVLLGIYTYSDYSSNNDRFEKASKKYARDTKSISNKATSDESKAAALKPQAEMLRIAHEPAQKPGEVLKVISSLVPKETWLTGVTFERGKIVQVRGTSTKPANVSAYVQELAKQKRFRDVRLMFANGGDISGVPTVQFSITLFPVGNLPIAETGKKKK